MSLLAMDTSSLFDPFEFPLEVEMDPPKPPETNFREKLEIRTKRHHDHHVKDMMVARESDFKSRDVMDIKTRPFDFQPKVHMFETPSPTAAPGVADMQTARQKLRDSLAAALDMVVSKQLVKSVLGVGATADAVKDTGVVQISSSFEESKPASLSQELENPKDGQTVESLVVDLGPLETEAMNIDSMGGEMSVSEPPASVDDYRLNFDQAEFGNGADVVESPFKKLKTEFAQFDYVHRKLEIEEKEGRIAVEDVKGGLHIVDLARKLATDIEAELFKLYGSKKTYNQKARSLLFNLKDKSNPELRARVFSGEIPPADLCRMSGEQLASKELSDWRNAKEQALDKMLVLTDADTVSGKVVKKTHKGEFVVDVQNESTVDIVPAVSRSVFPVNKVEEKAQQEDSEQTEGQANYSPNKSRNGSSPSLKRSRSDENDRVGAPLSYSSSIGEERTATLMIDAELPETETSLPTILSLDEYMEAQDEGGVQEDVFEDAPIESRDSLTPTEEVEAQEAPDSIEPLSKRDESPSVTDKPVKEETVIKRDESPSVKHAEPTPVLAKKSSDAGRTDKVGVAWTGQIQLSGNRQSPLSVSHRSGEKVDLKHWPKSLELKGRVRLAHLDKFLQELQQSRSRAVTVVSVLVQEGHLDQTSATEHVKEVASQYQMGDRVGFVEPRSGYELYLLPPGSGTTKLLGEHGHPDISPEALGKDVVLVGVIVWRRSHLSSSSSRAPDRNNNSKRHAVASSTHHESISKSSRAGVDPSTRSRSSSSRGGTNVSAAAAAAPPPPPSMHLLKFPVESSPTKDLSPAPAAAPAPVKNNWPSSSPTPTPSHATVLKAHRITPAPSDATTDMPPGFSVRSHAPPPPPSSSSYRPDPRQPPPQAAADVPPGFWPRPAAPAAAPQKPLADEDDDLPEFDFSVHTLPPPPPPAAASSLPPPPRPPPPSQDFLSRAPPPNYYTAPMEDPALRVPGAMLQYGATTTTPPLAALPRTDLPEWRPSAQFQYRPPVYFDPAAAVGGVPPPPQEMTWPPPQAPPPLPSQWQQQQPQEQQHYQQWQHFQPQQQQQQIRPVDPRGASSFNSWDGATWDATTGARTKDPRSNVDQASSWHDTTQRPEFRRR